MGDLELDLFLNLRRHVLMRVASTPEAIIQVLPYPVEEINIENHTSRRVARYQPARREAAEVRSLSRARESVRRADPSRDKNIVVGVLAVRSEEHTSELQSLTKLVCRLLLEKKKKKKK